MIHLPSSVEGAMLAEGAGVPAREAEEAAFPEEDAVDCTDRCNELSCWEGPKEESAEDRWKAVLGENTAGQVEDERRVPAEGRKAAGNSSVVDSIPEPEDLGKVLVAERAADIADTDWDTAARTKAAELEAGDSRW